MARNRRRNKRNAKQMSDALKQELNRIADLDQAQVLREKEGQEEEFSGATNTLGSFFTKEMLDQIP